MGCAGLLGFNPAELIVAPWLARAVHRQTLTSPRPDLRSFRVYRRYTSSLGSDQDKYVAAGHRPHQYERKHARCASIIGVELLFVSGWLGHQMVQVSSGGVRGRE